MAALSRCRLIDSTVVIEVHRITRVQFGSKVKSSLDISMKQLPRFYLLLLVCLVFTTHSLAQQPTPEPDGWRGLVVEVSTAEDAIRILGKPSSDKSGQNLKLILVDKWFPGGKYNQKIFRRLTFKKPEGLEQAQLSFLDNKLVLIQLDARTGEVPDWVDPDDLSSMFNTEFIYSEWHFGKKLPPLAEFEKLDSAAPKKFAELYHLIAITDRSFIVAGVDNIKARGLSLIGPPCTGCANSENNKRKARDAGGSFPGQVWSISIVSRRLGDNQTPSPP
jgi:hypothetical protein